MSKATKRWSIAATIAAGVGFATGTANAGPVDDMMGAASELPQQDMSEMICVPVFGWFDATSIPPPTCESVVGVCTAGNLHGVLQGGYELTLEQLMDTGDPRVPFVGFFTGTSDLSTQLGDFVGVDTGALNLSAPGQTGSGRLSTLLTIVEGGAGFIHIKGGLDFATGNVVGSYSGVVCWDWDDPEHGWGHHDCDD